MDVYLALIILAVVILLGIFGELFFRKTGIPDVLWLILFGYLLAHSFNLISADMFGSILSLFVALTLIIILFEGGLHLKLGGVIKNSLTGSGLAILTFLTTMGATALLTQILHYAGIIPEWSWWSGIIFGGIIGGTSSIVVLPLLKIAKLKEDRRDALSVESAFTDALCVVVVLTLLTYLSSTGQSLRLVLQSISASIAIGLVAGVIFGFTWLVILNKLKKNGELSQYFYVLTIALLIILYVFIEFIGGSAVVTLFIFGLILGNSVLLNKLFKSNLYEIETDMLIINSQFAFIIKSFFFVLMGILLQIELRAGLIALGLAMLLVGTRYFVINIIPATRKMQNPEKKLCYFFAPKGLAAGILAIEASRYSNIISGTDLMITLTFSIIIISIIISTIGLFAYKRWWSKDLIPEDKTEEGTVNPTDVSN